MRRDGGAFLRQKVKEKKRRERENKQASVQPACLAGCISCCVAPKLPALCCLGPRGGWWCCGDREGGRDYLSPGLQGEERLKWAKTEMSCAIRE